MIYVRIVVWWTVLFFNRSCRYCDAICWQSLSSRFIIICKFQIATNALQIAARQCWTIYVSAQPSIVPFMCSMQCLHGNSSFFFPILFRNDENVIMNLWASASSTIWNVILTTSIWNDNNLLIKIAKYALIWST